MKERSCTLMEKYINLIKVGKKTIEARVAIPMFRSWREEDIIKFFSKRRPSVNVMVKIKKIQYYGTFREMLLAEDVNKIIPGIKNVDEGVNLFMKIPAYRDREKKHGVIAFHLEKLS